MSSTEVKTIQKLINYGGKTSVKVYMCDATGGIEFETYMPDAIEETDSVDYLLQPHGYGF